jgi:hypothetical protein
MNAALRNIQNRSIQERSVVPGLTLMVIAAVITLLLLGLNSDLVSSFPLLYLLPWILGLAVVLACPTLYLYYRGRLTLADPLVFATWSYFFPAFVIGGVMLTAGLSQPYFLTFIQDAEYNLPYTIVLLMLGFAGLSAGYFSLLGTKLGAAFSRYLPKREFDHTAMLVPSLFLLALGTVNTVIGFFWGVFGYQIRDMVESYAGLLYLTTLFWMQGCFMLWFYTFKRGKLDLGSVILVILLGGVMLGRALFAGNRASLLQAFFLVVTAFLLSGRRFTVRRMSAAACIMAVCLLAGTIYGTAFRDAKGGESSVSVGRYTENILDTFDRVGKLDLDQSLEFGFANLAVRLDILSSVAVIVSNYEQLEPYEESYGLDNNIWKDTSTFFVPRVLWNDKPVASEPRKYADLYFGSGENSFAITPISDLLRNYGPVGVPVGMFLFGVVLRFVYRSLVENQARTLWRSTMYFMLVMTISYEGFYGQLIPMMIKTGITVAVGLFITALIAAALGYRPTAEPV